MTTYAVRYTYSDDTAGRDEHRPAHRDFLGDLGADGTLLLSGPFPDAEPAGALLLLEATSADEVRELLREDPLQAPDAQRLGGRLVVDDGQDEELGILGELGLTKESIFKF